MDRQDEREQRAQARRANYPGSVTQAGQEKPALYSELTLLERLAHQTALVAQQSALSGQQTAQIPRSQWPGEIFRIDEADARTG